MSNTLMVIWLAIILGGVFAEALTEKLIFVWCAPAAAAAFVCGLFGISSGIQSIVFAGLSAAMISTAQIVCKIMKRRTENNNAAHDINIDKNEQRVDI